MHINGENPGRHANRQQWQGTARQRACCSPDPTTVNAIRKYAGTSGAGGWRWAFNESWRPDIKMAIAGTGKNHDSRITSTALNATNSRRSVAPIAYRRADVCKHAAGTPLHNTRT